MTEDTHRAFWADEVADEIEARDPTDPVVVKGGVSPSGVPHLGHANEILRGYYVAEVLRERGHEVRQVFTADDRDRLRSVPRRLADLDGNVVGLGEVDAGALGRNLGRPYTDIPDPFGCCDSYGDHFTTILADAADRLGVPIDVVSNTDLYEEGAFEDVTRRLLERHEAARDLLADHQAGIDADYVPFLPQCSSCGNLTDRVLAVDLEAGVVEYECVDVEAGEQVIEGCGHRGTATLREGKLPWRFEWPAQWAVLGVDFEPFGKDHAEGSWPSGREIARDLLDVEPPVPMVYEWFTLDGEPLSSSSGNVVTVDEVLGLAEPEVVRYFFAKTPRKQRDFDVERLDLLVDEFDRFERLYFGEAEGQADETALAERAYPFVVGDPAHPPAGSALAPAAAAADAGSDAAAPVEARRTFLADVFAARVRLPYTFAAVLGMTDDAALRRTWARRQDHLPADAPAWVVEAALERVPLARTWAEREDNAYNYRLQGECPDVDFDDDVRAALDDLADFVAAGHDGEAIQGEVYETARRHDVPVGAFFGAGYRLFLGEDSGPQLGPLLGALDPSFAAARLRRER
ncbi:MAG: lysine--tRNA ligase [Halobacteriaceae archaeon]